MKKYSVLVAAALAFMLAVPWQGLGAAGAYEKGVAFLRAGNVDEALRLLEPLAATGGDDPYVFYHLGVAYYQADRLDEAYAALEKTRSMATGRVRDELGLGVAFSNLGVQAYRSGGTELARKSLKIALEINPDDGDSAYYLGLVDMQDGDYDAALARFDKASGLLSDDEAASVAIGNAAALAHYKKGDNASALSGFSASLKLDPDNLEALYYMGEISYKERGYEAARPYFDRIAQSGATDEATKKALFTTFFNMGVDFQDRGRSKSAAEMFDKAALLEPDDAEAHYYLGYNLMALGRYEEAAAEFRQALSLNPGLERAKTQLEIAGKFASDKALKEAAGRFGSGDYYAALPLYEKALSLDPSNGDAKTGVEKARAAVREDTKRRVAEARAFLESGDYEAARDGAENLLRLNPGSGEAKKLGSDIRAAISSVSGALIKKASEAEAKGALGEAAKAYEALLTIDPDDEKAKNGRARVNSRIQAAREKAAKAAGNGLLPEARAAYSRLLVYVPDDPKARAGLKSVEEAIALELARLIKEAEESFGAEDYTMAAHHAGRALELDPGNRDAAELRQKIKSRTTELVQRYVMEGDSSLEEGLREKAAQSYEAALTLDPDNRAAKDGLVKAQSAQAAPGNEEEVRRLYLKGVEYYTQGELELAVEAWREILRVDPGNEKAASSIRRAREKMRQTGETGTGQ